MLFLRTVKALPTPLLALFGIFALLPVAALFFFHDPFQTLLVQGPLKSLLILAAYWAMPAMICYFTLKRSFAIIPLFFFECALLLLHSIENVHAQPVDVQLVRYGLLAGMTLFTVTFLNKDVLYPLLSGNGRAWRSAPRLYVNVPMQLWYQDSPDQKLPIVIHNCSLTGIGLSGPHQQLKELLEHKDKLNHFLIQVGYSGKHWMLNVKLARTREEAAVLYAGFRVFNSEAMHEFIAQMETLLPPQKTVAGWLSRYWVRSGFRHAVLALWAVSILSMLAMPV